MFQVSRLNLVYSAEEDRLRLACENATGGRLVLWLTRRLVLRLLAELAELVQPAAAGACGAGARSNATTRDGAAPDDRETAAVCPGSPAFADNTGGIGFLVTRLRLRLAQGEVSLGFMGEGDAVVQLDLDSLGVQRWLELLAASCQAAHWPLRSAASAVFSRGGVERSRVLH